MKKLFPFLILILLIVGCSEEPKKKNTPPKKVENSPSIDSLLSANQSSLTDFEKNKVKELKKLDNGMLIKWLNKGTGNKLQVGEVVLIEYRLALPDGKIIDGNQRAKLPFIPFIIGYNMQTLGWDLALQELKVGDFVKVEMPAYLGRGEKGIPGLIPPNSVNWLYLKILARVSPEYDQDGIKTWTFAPGVDTESIPGRENEVEYHALISTASNPNVMNTYRAKFPLKYTKGQRNVVPGLQQVLSKVKKGQKIYVLLDPEQAYGNRGYVNIVKPNESVFYNITVKDIRPI
jgi:FKBP-type peptidyl-prolyl cis-trans isomerase